MSTEAVFEREIPSYSVQLGFHNAKRRIEDGKIGLVNRCDKVSGVQMHGCVIGVCVCWVARTNSGNQTYQTQ